MYYNKYYTITVLLVVLRGISPSFSQHFGKKQSPWDKKVSKLAIVFAQFFSFFAKVIKKFKIIASCIMFGQ